MTKQTARGELAAPTKDRLVDWFHGQAHQQETFKPRRTQTQDLRETPTVGM